MGCPVLARLVSDQLFKVFHIRVNFYFICSQGAEQQLEALLRLQGGDQGYKVRLILLKLKNLLCVQAKILGVQLFSNFGKHAARHFNTYNFVWRNFSRLPPITEHVTEHITAYGQASSNTESFKSCQ